jgi:LAO/AO transport system kinase
MMEEEKRSENSINVKKGIIHPPNINPDAKNRLSRKRKRKYTVDEYIDGILSGDRTVLSQAITLIESSIQKDSAIAQLIIERCLPFSSRSIRIGITGVPGVGKSTFIEELGKLITSEGRSLAVLAIDPSSENTRGSILGDKTRMDRLSNDPDAFIRPSPASGILGGVARKTRETIILCEAAGFDTIIVETVGVGQSETAVSSMVDFFLLLMLAGAGDELQGMKRGIMEMADTIAITKADGNNRQIAEGTKAEFQTALHLFPPSPSGWKPNVVTCSSVEGTGIKEIWQSIQDYLTITKQSGYFEEKRNQQSIIKMRDTILETLKSSFYSSNEIKKTQADLETRILQGTITPYKAALDLLNKYFKT